MEKNKKEKQQHKINMEKSSIQKLFENNKLKVFREI